MKIGDLAIHKGTGEIGLVLAVGNLFYKIQWTVGLVWHVPKQNVRPFREE
tara:strand:+ start:1017 stop:1166 length:150 start_codon:yes stop_codon:yes gene_type:complete